MFCLLPQSTNIYCSRDDEDASPGISNSPLKASLSARLFKKYNPEKSESDVDDFEHFLQKIRTPKQSRLSGEERKREASLNEFIVDDADEDQEEDVFYDPGYTPELEELSDDDKENDDCIEISTAASSITPFKTPRTISSITPFKTPRSTTSSTPLMSAKSNLYLDRPFYSGLAARLYLARIPDHIPKDILSQAEYVKTYYLNNENVKDKIPVKKFIEDVNCARGCANYEEYWTVLSASVSPEA